MKSRNKIKAILSDGGGILFDDSHQKNELYDFVRKNRNLSKKKFMSVWSKYKIKAQTKEGYDRERAYADTLKKFNIPYKTYVNYLNSQSDIVLNDKTKVEVKLKPHVNETISEMLKNGYNYIVMTDATKHGYELESKLEKMGLENHVDVISSKDIGACKPSKKFFDYVLKRYKLKKDEVLFLAHDHDELYGAKKLGYDILDYNKMKDFSDIMKILSYKSERRKTLSYNEFV